MAAGRGRWIVLGGAVIVEAVGGVLYAFSLYSECLKAAFDLSQTQLTTIGFASLLGGNVGVDIGLLNDTRGAVAVLLVSALLSAVGWLPMWAALTYPAWSGTPFGVLFILSMLQGHAQLANDIAAVSVTVRCFPNHRGLALGVTKSLIGLSGSLATVVYVGVFKPLGDDGSGSSTTPDDGSASASNEGYVDHFLLFICIWSVVFTLIGALLMVRGREGNAPPTAEAVDGEATHEVAENGEYIKRALRCAYAGIMVLALLLLAFSLVEKADAGSLSRGAKVGMMCAAFSVFFAVVVFIVTRSGSPAPELDPLLVADGGTSAPPHHPPAAPRKDTPQPLQQDAAANSSAASTPRDFSAAESLRMRSFWLHCAVLFFGTGACLTVSDNLGQMTLSLGMAKGAEDTYVSLFSVCNCAGRLGFGVASDVFVRRWGLPRVWAFIPALGLAVCMCLLLLVHSQAILAPAVVAAGLAFGGLNSIHPACVSEMFGLAHIGMLYSLTSIVYALGTFVFATQLAGRVYDHNKSAGDDDCHGAACFRTTWLVCACGCAVAMLLSAAYAHGARERYALLYPGEEEVKEEDVPTRPAEAS